MGGALVAALAILALAGTGEGQEARVSSTRPEGVEIETAQLGDLQPGARVGFLRLAEGRREVGAGWVLGVSPGRAIVGLAPGGEVRVGDLVIRCQDAGNIDALRGAVAQLRAQVQGSGQTSGDLGARLGVIQTVMQARDAAAARGACDLGEYDAQLTLLARDLQTATAAPVAAAPMPAAPVPGAPGMPPPAVAAGPPVGGAPAPGMPGAAPTPGQPAGTGGDMLSKVAGGVQSLLEKFLGGGGGGGGGQAPSFSGGAPPPQFPTSAPAPPASFGGGSPTFPQGGFGGQPGGAMPVPNPGTGPGGLVPASPTPPGRVTVTSPPSTGWSTTAPAPVTRRPLPPRRPGLPGPGFGPQAP